MYSRYHLKYNSSEGIPATVFTLAGMYNQRVVSIEPITIYSGDVFVGFDILMETIDTKVGDLARTDFINEIKAFYEGENTWSVEA